MARGQPDHSLLSPGRRLGTKYKWSNASFGDPVPPDVRVSSPISNDWYDQISNKLKEKHPELFEGSTNP
jgi:hypothetical protein